MLENSQKKIKGLAQEVRSMLEADKLEFAGKDIDLVDKLNERSEYHKHKLKKDRLKERGIHPKLVMQLNDLLNPLEETVLLTRALITYLDQKKELKDLKANKHVDKTEYKEAKKYLKETRTALKNEFKNYQEIRSARFKAAAVLKRIKTIYFTNNSPPDPFLPVLNKINDIYVDKYVKYSDALKHDLNMSINYNEAKEKGYKFLISEEEKKNRQAKGEIVLEQTREEFTKLSNEGRNFVKENIKGWLNYLHEELNKLPPKEEITSPRWKTEPREKLAQKQRSLSAQYRTHKIKKENEEVKENKEANPSSQQQVQEENSINQWKSGKTSEDFKEKSQKYPLLTGGEFSSYRHPSPKISQPSLKEERPSEKFQESNSTTSSSSKSDDEATPPNYSPKPG